MKDRTYNWFENNPTKSIIIYTLTVIGAVQEMVRRNSENNSFL